MAAVAGAVAAIARRVVVAAVTGRGFVAGCVTAVAGFVTAAVTGRVAAVAGSVVAAAVTRALMGVVVKTRC